MAEELDVGYFLDLAVFTLAFDAYASLTSLEDEHAQATGSFRSRLMAETQAGIEKYVLPLLDEPGFGVAVASVRLALRPKRTLEQLQNQAAALKQVFSLLRTRRELMETTFSEPRALAGARLLAASTAKEDAASALNAIATIPPASRLRVTKAWIREAAERAGVGPTLFEATVEDVKTASSLGAELRSVDAQLASADPNSPEAAELAGRRADLQAEIEETVNESASPDVTLAAAVTAAAKSSNYATKTGAKARLSPAQEAAMMVRGKAVIAAGAGSGKTATLSAKVAYHVNELGVPLTSIMATSFTRKSAAELNERIQKHGVTFTKQAAAGFGTTHSIARKLMMEYGGPIRGDLKSYAQKTLIRLAMKQVEMTGGTGDPQVTPLVALAGTQEASGAAEGGAGLTFLQACEKALDNRSRLNPFLRGFIESFFNPRDQWYSRTMRATKNLTDPAGLTEKQMGLLQGIFKQTGVSYSPSTDPNLTKKARTAAGKPSGFDKYISFKEPARQWFNLGLKLTSNGKEDGTPISPGTFAMAITNFKGKMVSPSEAWTRFRSPEAAVYGAYEYLKGSNGEPDFQGTGDFDDVLIDISKFLLSNPAALQKVQNRFKTILIDEAQDQNRAQHLMFGLIAGYVDPAKAHLAGTVEKVKDLAYDDGRISADTYALIGDDKQAIYEFRSADPASFIDMSDLVAGGAGFKTAVLNTNYRSGKHIVDTAMNIIRNNDKQIPMVCEANPERIRSGAVNAVSFTPVQNGDFREPAMWFAETVEELMEQDPPQKGYSGFGIGVRTNAEAYAYSLELLKRGIPFKSKTNFFGDKTTKAMIAWLTLADETGDVDRINDAVLEATSAPKSMLGQRFVDAVKEQATGNYADWLQTNWSRIYGATGQWARAVENFASNLNEIRALNGQSPQVVLAKILALKGVDGLSFIEALKEKVREDEDAMSDLRSESAQGEVDEGAVETAALAPIDPLKALLESRADLTESMKYIRTLQAANNKLGKNDDPEDPAFKQPAVTIGTVHSWKGLEVENMFVPFTGGKFPRADAEGDDLEGDRRLAYVAVTRGEERVYIMDIPTVRQVGEKFVIQTSRFVEEACVPTVPNWESPTKRGEDDDDAGAGVDPDEDGEAAAEAMARVASKLANDFLPLPPGGTWLSDEMIESYESIKAGGR